MIFGLHVPSSPFYWAIVGTLTVAFAIVDLEALRRREVSRWHWLAIAVYVGSWGVVGLSAPNNGEVWLAFPVALRIAFGAVFFGGHLLAAAVREERRIAHPARRGPKARRPET